jgi:hypothetical protein
MGSDNNLYSILLLIISIIAIFVLGKYIRRQTKVEDDKMIAEWKSVNGNQEAYVAFIIHLIIHAMYLRTYPKTEAELITWFTERIKRMYNIDLNEIK